MYSQISTGLGTLKLNYKMQSVPFVHSVVRQIHSSLLQKVKGELQRIEDIS